jgi:hypothetical protein
MMLDTTARGAEVIPPLTWVQPNETGIKVELGVLRPGWSRGHPGPNYRVRPGSARLWFGSGHRPSTVGGCIARMFTNNHNTTGVAGEDR